MKMDQRTEHQGPKGKLTGDAATAQNTVLGRGNVGSFNTSHLVGGAYTLGNLSGASLRQMKISFYTLSVGIAKKFHTGQEYKWIPKMFWEKRN